MYRLIILTLFISIAGNKAWSQQASAADLKDLEAAETRMFENVKYPTVFDYFRTDVTDDFFSINADGTTSDKLTSTKDTARLKMFAMPTYKQLDRKYRIYGNVGITNGRMQAFMNGTLLVEFLYTAVFVKQNGKWMYASWQGTISKDSPPPPPMPKN